MIVGGRLKTLEGVGVEGWVCIDKEETDWVFCVVGNERILAKNGGSVQHTEAALREYEQFRHKHTDSGASILLVSIDDKLHMCIAMMDACREESELMIAVTRRSGISVLMLTGDQETTALYVAAAVGIDATDVKSRLMPQEKLKCVQDEQKIRGKKVLMLGDGVNDAAALAAAHVGMAMGSGASAMANVAAQIVCLSDNILRVIGTVVLCRLVRKIIYSNIFFSLGLKFAALILAFTGHLQLWQAILVDMISIVFVLTCSLMPTLILKSIWQEGVSVGTADTDQHSGHASPTSLFPMYDPEALSSHPGSAYTSIPITSSDDL